jgi:phospholipid-binding lipoprotein MlaA
VKIFIDKIKILNIIIIIALSNFIILQNSYSLNGNEGYIDSDFEDFEDFHFNLDHNHENEIYDPFESFNRNIFIFNDNFDRYFFQYIAIAYQKSLPGKIRYAIRNFTHNFSMPFVIFNSILQGDLDNTMSSFSSFLINSTIGLFGFIDIADRKNIAYNREDFGQTLASYGVKSGPYLVIPFLGPSNLRDLFGFPAKILFNLAAVRSITINGNDLIDDDDLTALSIISLIDKRESLLDVISDARKNSFDLYTLSKSAHMQNRRAAINNKINNKNVK